MVMEKNASPLVHFTPHDAYALQRGEEAFATIGAYPEIQQKIEQGNALHGKTLEVLLGQNLNYSGYNPATHQIHYNPTITDASVLIDEKGWEFSETPERFFAHVIEHTTQVGFAETAMQYDTLFIAINNALTAPFFEAIAEQADAIRTIMNDTAQLEKVLNAIYDEHIGQSMREKITQFELQLVKNPIVEKFNHEFETPAIRFENLIAHKYLNETIRTTDYVQETTFQARQSLKRERLVGALMKTLAAATPKPNYSITTGSVFG